MTSSVTKTKYPIICAPMNGVSDVKLAIACSNSGIVASLVLYNYTINGKVDLNLLEQSLSEYTAKTNFGTLLIACELNDLLDINFQTLLIKYKVSFVEVLDCEKHNAQEIYNQYLSLNTKGIIIYPKLIAGYSSVKKLFDHIGKFSHVLIKGENGGGCSIDNINLDTEIIKIKESYPDINLIVSGGINNGQDIKRLLNLGADAVACGTLFCASTESSIPLHTKQKIIENTYDNVKRLDSGYQQKALIFSKLNESDINNTEGLLQGIKTGDKGHIFVGSAINYINQIEPIQSIVNKLVLEL